MARRSEHSKEQIRDMALEAAETIVATDGLAGLSARKIAKQIGYTVGTLYLVFRNLDDLVLHVNARTLDAMFVKMQESLQKCRTPRTCVVAMGRAYVEFATDHPNRWNMVFEHQLAEDEQVPHWFADKVNKMFHLVEMQLIPLLEHQSEKKIDMVSKAIWCGVHGICSLAVTGKLDIRDAESIHVLTDSLINNYLAGLATTLKGE
ncbi:MAG: TetR/AcrR family transcriptional regulator [Gammaproteobacteria bacterium]|jgi:AcrR family transcriptional regulator